MQTKIDNLLETQYNLLQRWAKLSMHDNNNIINNINLALYQLKDEDGDIDEETKGYCFKIIEDNIKKINNPFYEIVNNDHQEQEYFEILKEIRIIRDEILELYAGKPIEIFIVNENIDSQTIKANKKNFIFIYEELIKNAVNFAPPHSKVYVNNAVQNNSLHINFKNQVNNTTQNAVDQLVIFYSSKEKGVGLGLHKVRDIINQLNGSMKINYDNEYWNVDITIPL